jgi:cytoskeletal protein RodZ
MYIYDNNGNRQDIELKEKYEEPNHPTESYQENFTQPSYPETKENFDSSSPNYNLYVGLIVGGIILVLAISVGAWMWSTKRGPFASSSVGSSMEQMSLQNNSSASSNPVSNLTAPASGSSNSSAPAPVAFGFRFY